MEVTQSNKICFHQSLEKAEHSRLYLTGLHSFAPASNLKSEAKLPSAAHSSLRVTA